DVYDTWNRIAAPTLSNDGRWALFALTSEANDPSLTVTDVAGQTRHVIERAEAARFDDGTRFVAFTIKPAKAAVKEARQEKTPPARMPPDTLGILDLQTGAVTRVPRTRGFRMPAKAGGWIAYQLGRAPDEKPDSAAADSAGAPGAVEPRRPEPGVMPEPPAGERPPAGEAATDSARPAPERKRDDGYPVILLNPASGEERRVEDVVSYAFSDDGARFAFTRSNKDGDADGVYVMDVRSGSITTLLSGKGQYKQLAFDDAGRQIAFISNVDEFMQPDTTVDPSWKVYHWDGRADAARMIVAPGTAGVPDGSWIPDNGAVRFSPNGQRLFFPTAPRPEPRAPKDDDDEEAVVVDVWSW